MSEDVTVLRIRGLGQLEELSSALLELGRNVPVWLFDGPMGVGKTTLIKALCEKLGVQEKVTSPTFALVNEYETADRKLVYHFDFYRINHETEALDMGVEEYFDSGNYCFVEWPGKIESLWPQTYLLLSLDLTLEQERILTIREMNA
ncbi:tRNA (adenosine(37)-N6)-threonylcarbamoyltransferase complex ATPase subunit type 1 TsaE [Dyadobacter tibetensis]|uniref:tRNA (adenosine(37)-N6)-threonylcarbamoyltransferase complex ATPase subunit type 1 TsaE n=1 Tax=Dyadobacter tibetensis TaxID=1211851 RepID=UPI0004704384|nr:tRNA (adenosine(37)-N6)-threonylcarbamoyltransferase complex ATPase subunit type 1 TsaE [Dyadobacter tibetensis]